MRNTNNAKLFNELIRFETELWDTVDISLRKSHNLPLSWFEPMQVIDQVTRCRVADIVSALSITVGGASKLIDRIEVAGFCRRRSDAGDGRSSIIELTTKGKAMLVNANKTFIKTLDLSIGSRASDAMLTQFIATIQQLRVGLKDSKNIKQRRTRKG